MQKPKVINLVGRKNYSKMNYCKVHK